MKTSFTPEIGEKIKQAKTAAELLTFAKENGIPLTESEAEEFFVESHRGSGDITDEELQNVAGGAVYGPGGYMVVYDDSTCDYWSCYYCKSPVSAHKSAGGTAKHPKYSCPDGVKTVEIFCRNCSFGHYCGGLGICFNPINCKD